MIPPLLRSGRLGFWVLLLAASLAEAAESALPTSLQPLKGLPCENAIRDTLNEWKAVAPHEQWRGAGVDLEGNRVFRTPTATLGAWIQLSLLPDRSVRLMRISDDTNLTASWNPNDCKPTLSDQKIRQEADFFGRFTTQELRDLLAGQGRGIIYVWSPSMTLSVRGVDEIKRWATSHGFEFTAVCDSAARESEKKKIIEAKAWPKSYGKSLASTELLMLGMTIHYPSAIVFADGKIVSPSFPGHEEPALFAKFVDRYLKKAGAR